MEGSEKVFNVNSAGEATEKKEGRERSTIEFPYGDLEDALEVARAIHNNAGLECTVDQLAGYMGQTTTSGSFRTKVSTAKTFSVIASDRGGPLRLTELGERLVDPNRERGARSDAFLAVPLYKAVYDRYRGKMLPPTAALQREMTALGVSSKQSDRARQAFERSAQQAGFFDTGTDRLVVPAGLNSPPPADDSAKDDGEDNGGGGNGGGSGGGGLDHLDPIIKGLLVRLPPSGSKWSKSKREQWLQLFSGSFDLIYEDGSD